jgi:zinc protease
MASGNTRFQRHIFPSGFTLVSENDVSSPAAAFHLWVRVGSAHENEKEAGLSHFLEHMLFKGTETMDSVALNDAIENLGGNMNAFTSFEETAYHMVLPKKYWSEGLTILLDMVFHSVFDQEEVEIERQVILEELHEGDDSPDSLFGEKFFEKIYPGHGYGRPVIGTIDSIKSFSRGDLTTWYDKHYQPSEMVLTVCGDVPWEKLFEVVRTHLGDLSPGKAQRWSGPSPTLPTYPLHLSFQKGNEERIVELAFPIPGALHEDIPLLDLLSCVVGEGEISRLNQALRIRNPLARSVSMNTFTPTQEGQFLIRIYPYEGKEIQGFEETLRQLQMVREYGISSLELQRAKLLLEKELLFNDETPEGRARTMAYFQTMAGGVEEEEKYRVRYLSATEEMLLQVARKYLLFDRLAVGTLSPASVPPPEERDFTLNIQACLAHKDESQKSKSAPVLDRVLLPNGLSVILRSNPHSKIASLFAVSMGGLRSETLETNGVANLVAATMDRGTSSRSLDRIAEEAMLLQAELGSAIGRNTLGLRMDVSNRNLIQAVPLFADVLLHPKFSAASVDIERSVILQELAAQEDYFETFGANLFTETIFPNHPLGMNPLGRSESLQELKSDALKKHHREWTAPNRTVLCVVGNFVKEELVEALEREWDRPAIKADAETEAKPLSPIDQLVEVRRPIHGEKAYIWYGFRGIDVRSPERYAFEVLSSLLSSSGGGRLYVRLREELGLLYSIDVAVFQGIDTGYLAVHWNTTLDRVDVSYEEVRNELAKVARQGVSPQELERVKNYLIGLHQIDLQRSGAQAALLSLGELYGTEKDLDDFTRGIATVTPSNVQEVAQKYLTLDQGVRVLLSPGVN